MVASLLGAAVALGTCLLLGNRLLKQQTFGALVTAQPPCEGLQTVTRALWDEPLATVARRRGVQVVEHLTTVLADNVVCWAIRPMLGARNA